MATLYEIFDNAHDGEGMTALGQEFGLTRAQTQAAVTALLPAISTGLKQSTATLDGLANLFGVMGQQQNLHAMYDDPEMAFGPEGVAAGNDALSAIFGSPDVSRAVIDQAQNFSGMSSNILKKMLPVLAGVLISGLMRSGSSGKAASPGQPAPAGGSLGDILGQIFGRGMPGSPSAPAEPGQKVPPPASQPPPLPTDAGGQPAPDGDLLGSILRELEKGIREGRIKPVIIGGGPVQIPMPGRQEGPMPSGSDVPRVPGGDIFGQILRDVFGGGVGGPAQMPQGRQGQSPQICVTAIALILAVSTTAGFAFAKLRYRGSGTVFLAVVAALMVPLQSIIIPEYVNLGKFGLINTYFGAILVYVALGIPFATFLMATYYRGISDDLIEAAVMDGLGYGKTFLRIAVPLSWPAIATITVLQFIQIWDDLLVGLLFLQNPQQRTITVGLAALSAGRTTSIPVLMAGSFISALPAIIVFLIFQRYLVRGLTLGMGK